MEYFFLLESIKKLPISILVIEFQFLILDLNICSKLWAIFRKKSHTIYKKCLWIEFRDEQMRILSVWLKKNIHLLWGIFLIVLVIEGLTFTSSLNIDSVKFHSSVRKGALFKWKINTVQTVANVTEWEWEWANNVILSQDEYIQLEWLSDPDESSEIDILGPLNYNGLTVKVGSQSLVFDEDETFFNFLIAPLYTRNKLGQIEAGLNTLERIWFNTYKLPNAYLPLSYSEYIWTFDMENATLANTGENGSKDSIVLGHITTHDFFIDTNETETYVFDIAYSSDTGIVDWIRFPSSGSSHDPTAPIANFTHGITKDLKELLITYSGQESTPSFEVGFTLLSIFSVVITLNRIKRKKKF